MDKDTDNSQRQRQMRGSDSGPYAPPGVKSGEVTGSYIYDKIIAAEQYVKNHNFPARREPCW